MPENDNQYTLLQFLQGGGEMGELIRSLDWSKTPLGEPGLWPVVLKTTVAMMLHNSFPVLICWGEDYIQLYNDAFRPINGRDKHPSALGGRAQDTYKEIWGQIGGMFAGVMKGERFGYPDFMVLLERYGAPEECYFDFSYSPILDENGRIGGIIVVCMETTEKVKATRAREIQQQNLRNTVKQAPVGVCIVKDSPLMVQEMNDMFLEIIGKEREPFNTLPYWEVNAEDRDYYEPITEKVLRTGQTFHVNEHEIMVIRQGLPETVYVDFVYQPILDSKGKPESIIIVAIDVTDKVIARRKVEEVREEIQASNEDLAEANEELACANEELAQINDDLLLSEGRFRNLIRQSPFGICVIRAHDLMIAEVNDGYLELVGKKRSELEGRAIWEGVPEAADTYAPLMKEVIRTAQPLKGKEHELTLIRNGIPENVFVDFVYEPVIEKDGKVVSIMVVAIDVTDKVIARRSIEDVEERIRLAVESAEIGTYEYIYAGDQLIASDRFFQIFGFHQPVSRNQVIATYHPADMHLSEQAHESATSGKIFHEARILLSNGQQRFVRVQGNIYYDEQGERKKVLGTVLDITEYKLLQQQKDDFISIASHELKTPLTSLKASLQLLQRMKEQPNEKLPMLIDQSTRSMKKISELVEDLLNVSKLNHGHLPLNKTKFRISQLLEACCNPIRHEGKYTLMFQGDRELEIEADEHQIEQVVVNFVTNAVKYAPESQIITLIAERTGNFARISVRDTGQGISSDKLPHLFDRYFRADHSGSQVSGLGLGLYICAEIVEKHGGKIGVDSERGKGSTFWFELPLNPDSVP